MTIFVTGVSEDEYATVAYESSTGARIWTRRYDGPGDGPDHAVALAVTPDGTTLFVTGGSTGPRGGSTTPPSPTTHPRAPVGGSGRYDGPGTGDHGNDQASALAVSPDGTTLFVTGWSAGPMTHTDYATIAYDVATGDRIWVQRFDGAGSVNDAANALAVSPTERRCS